MLESQQGAVCRGGEQRRPARSPTHNTKHRIRTPRYPSLPLHSALSPPYILSHNSSQIPVNAFRRRFSKSGPCTLTQFQWHLSLIRGPTGTALAPALLPQIVSILQYIIRLGCWPFVLPLRLLPSQIDSTAYTYTGIWDGSD